MTQEEKQLLIKDLCQRLPYGVRVKQGSYESKLRSYDDYTISFNSSCAIPIPYLRPMSSMTEEEKKELKEISYEYLDEWMSINDPSVRWELDAKIASKRAEFYNSHYLDWNGLIEKGVALEAPEDIYKI